jgi:adenosylcobinamide-GDP ribazoletransferase
MRAPWFRFLTAMQFLTRLPVPDPGWEEGRLRAALPYFPVAGAVVGGLGAGVWWLAAGLLPGAVAAGLALGAMMLATGALHEDGLGDVADGLGGGRDAGHALEIMRDSRVGSYALVALILVIGLKWAALAGLGRDSGALAILVAAVIARAAMVAASAMAPPARPEGLGAMLGAGASRTGLAAALGLALAVALLAGAAGVGALLAGLVATALMVGAMRRRVGGMTGDGFGAVAALAETAALVVLAGAWGAA